MSTAAVERAAEVLLLFAPADSPTPPDLGVTEIAQQAGLSKAVVHRILSSLRTTGLVELDEPTRRYRLGPAALQLGQAYLAGVDLKAIARPELEALSAATGETALLAVPQGSSRVFVDQVAPAREIRMVAPIGEAVPLHVGALSRVLLAFLPAAEQDAYLAALPSAAKRGLRAELARIVEDGAARSTSERTVGSTSVAAPVFGADGRPLASLAVSGPTERLTPHLAEAGELVIAAAARVSARLGHRVPSPDQAN